MERAAGCVPDVRRTGTYLGGARRPRRTGERRRAAREAFLEHADDYQGVPVFYQVTREWLHRYADFGLTFAKLGEEARVRLSDFSTRRRRYREEVADDAAPCAQGRRHLPRIAEAITPALLAEVRGVSDEWLAERGPRKGVFARLLRRALHRPLSLALIERNGRVRGVRQRLGGRPPGGGVGRPDASTARRRRTAMRGVAAWPGLYARCQQMNRRRQTFDRLFKGCGVREQCEILAQRFLQGGSSCASLACDLARIST